MAKIQKYFSYIPGEGENFFDNEAEAIKFANNAIEQCRNDAQDEWWEEDEVLGIVWGVVKQSAKECDRRYKPDTNGMTEEEIEEVESEFHGFDCLVDYKLADVESDLPTIPSGLLYEFYLDCGRLGDITGMFVATDIAVAEAIGKTIGLGEALGKHSNITFTLESGHLTVKSDDADFISKLAEVLGAKDPANFTVSGWNPLHNLDE